MKNAIIYTLEFVAINIICGFAIKYLWELLAEKQTYSSAMMITTVVITNILVIAIFLIARWAEVSPKWLRTRQWKVLTWSVIAALGAIIPSAWIQEQMPELPNFLENEFDMMITNRWGYLAIGLLAPFAEELVFRGAILKSLLRSDKLSPWFAIIISAMLFSLTHMNPTQMPHAFVIGILLGWMYWRTGSILPGIAYHWANNSAAYLIYAFYPSSDIQLIDIFKGSSTNVLMAVGFSLLILIPAIYQLHLWMKTAEIGK